MLALLNHVSYDLISMLNLVIMQKLESASIQIKMLDDAKYINLIYMFCVIIEHNVLYKSSSICVCFFAKIRKSYAM